MANVLVPTIITMKLTLQARDESPFGRYAFVALLWRNLLHSRNPPLKYSNHKKTNLDLPTKTQPILFASSKFIPFAGSLRSSKGFYTQTFAGKNAFALDVNQVQTVSTMAVMYQMIQLTNKHVHHIYCDKPQQIYLRNDQKKLRNQLSQAANDWCHHILANSRKESAPHPCNPEKDCNSK